MKFFYFFLIFILNGCYLTKQSYHHLKIIWNTIPLESAIAEETDPEKKELLSLVKEVSNLRYSLVAKSYAIEPFARLKDQSRGCWY